MTEEISKKIEEMKKEIKNMKKDLWETELKRRRSKPNILSYRWNGEEKKIKSILESKSGFEKRMETAIYPIRLKIAQLQTFQEALTLQRKKILKEIDEWAVESFYWNEDTKHFEQEGLEIPIKDLKQKITGTNGNETRSSVSPASTGNERLRGDGE